MNWKDEEIIHTKSSTTALSGDFLRGLFFRKDGTAKTVVIMIISRVIEISPPGRVFFSSDV